MSSFTGAEQTDRLWCGRDRREDAEAAHEPYILDSTVLLVDTGQEKKARGNSEAPSNKAQDLQCTTIPYCKETSFNTEVRLCCMQCNTNAEKKNKNSP